jgi:hypothetical protein
MSYHHISIEKVVADSIENFKMSGYERNDLGCCGISQSAIYYAAVKNNVPRDCIKICQASDIIKGTAHGFVILILDVPYLIDLSFSQFLCLWDKDKDSELIKNVFPADELISFSKNGYIPLTERFLIVYYTFLRRICGYPLELQDNKPLDEIKLRPNGFKEGESINLLSSTLFFDWKYEPEWDEEDVRDQGWNWF